MSVPARKGSLIQNVAFLTRYNNLFTGFRSKVVCWFVVNRWLLKVKNRHMTEIAQKYLSDEES